MRKILVPAILLIFIMLCGCSVSPTSQVTLPPSFIAEADITVGETAYTASLSRYADSCWQVEMLSPAAVKGLIFTVSNGETEVSFDGLHFTFDTGRFPAGSVVSAVIKNMDRLYAQPLDVIVGDEQSLASGTLDDRAYTLTLSKNNIPIKFELADGMCVEFTRFDLIEKVEEGTSDL